jgi:hypothetical protein
MRNLALLLILTTVQIHQLEAYGSVNNTKKEKILEHKLEQLIMKYSKASTKRSKQYYYQKIRRLLSKISDRELGIKKPRL